MWNWTRMWSQSLGQNQPEQNEDRAFNMYPMLVTYQSSAYLSDKSMLSRNNTSKYCHKLRNDSCSQQVLSGVILYLPCDTSI